VTDEDGAEPILHTSVAHHSRDLVSDQVQALTGEEMTSSRVAGMIRDYTPASGHTSRSADKDANMAMIARVPMSRGRRLPAPRRTNTAVGRGEQVRVTPRVTACPAVCRTNESPFPKRPATISRLPPIRIPA
jgi:hypothetical protein